jgi:organic hydroperoxide reductase OsmC/OhrA
VSLGPEGESYAIAVTIEVRLPGLDLAEAQRLVERTHELCPYSKATRGNVPVTVRAVDAL